MKEFKYAILGAGPAGLSVANTLLRGGEESFILLERESEAGGLCRSVYCDGAPVDIGGAHVLSPKNKKVTDFVFSFLPENEWELITRENTVKIGEYEVGYPLESNIWQFPNDIQNEYLNSIKNAGCQCGEAMPEKYIDWIYWKFGNRIADDYMIPYNTKMWNCDLNELGTSWLYKLPSVSYEDTLKSCRENKPCGKMPAHSKYYFPKKYGYGEPFLRMAKALGNHIVTSYNVKTLDYENRIINNEIKYDYIISTIPWKEISFNFPQEIKSQIEKLKYTSVDIDYYNRDYNHNTQITYFADTELPYHRIIYRKEMMQLENAVGYWTESNSERGNKGGDYSYTNEYAYPISTLGKEEAVSRIKHWAESKNIISLGRWGDWEHMNSDVAMAAGIETAEKLLKK